MFTIDKVLPEKFDVLTHQLTTPDCVVLRSCSYKSQHFSDDLGRVTRHIVRNGSVRILNPDTLDVVSVKIRSINSLKSEWDRNKDIVMVNNIEFRVCWSRSELIAKSENYLTITCKIDGYRASGILYGEKFNEIIYHN